MNGLGELLFIFIAFIISLSVGALIFWSFLQPASSKINEERVRFYMKQLNTFPHDLEMKIYEMMVQSNKETRKYLDVPTPDEINDVNTFHASFDTLTDVIFVSDRLRNVFTVNYCAIYMVKNYGDLINKYGTSTDKRIFNNNIRLLKMSRIISDDYIE